MQQNHHWPSNTVCGKSNRKADFIKLSLSITTKSAQSICNIRGSPPKASLSKPCIEQAHAPDAVYIAITGSLLFNTWTRSGDFGGNHSVIEFINCTVVMATFAIQIRGKMADRHVYGSLQLESLMRYIRRPHWCQKDRSYATSFDSRILLYTYVNTYAFSIFSCT